MFTPITFPSALIFWLTYDGRRKFVPVRSEEIMDPDPIFLSDSLEGFASTFQLPLPLHIMVPNQGLRHRGINYATHVLPGGLPHGSFVRVSGVPIICPELCFLLAAQYLTLQELAVLATDLCGTYALNPQAVFRQVSREPITSVQGITDYLTQARQMRGIRNAQSAVRYALDFSHSPMESKMGVTAILPYRHGGFAITRPEMNGTVQFAESGARHFEYSECCCDMLWRQEKVVVEYDSDLAHSTQNQIRKDKKKSGALQLSGYKVLNVTKDHFRNIQTIENLFLTIKTELKIRMRKSAYDQYRDIRQQIMRHFFLTEGAMDWLLWAENLCSQNME